MSWEMQFTEVESADRPQGNDLLPTVTMTPIQGPH
ncbi:hypothetical protein EGR_10336 [Echinococcus granulosus]|uniref:Uncharacterized protein n=1 Tax=Echinococcus granulosus TaxID=6210 RepID=W6U8L2_ECHGR|nr:hypothetical protein EGR_10336 [Echinococcus granulosus]EUB54807.1 hypothetical protein EGR_10336 [Echinococcus granulosus]